MGFNDINLQVSGPQQPASIYKTKVLKGQVPFATQVTEPNTKYVIKHNFVLNSDVTIPANCILEFDGGSISGEHTLTGANTGIQAGLVKIFDTDVVLGDTWNVVEAYPEWFNSDSDVDNINAALHYFYNVRLSNKEYKIDKVDENGYGIVLEANRALRGIRIYENTSGAESLLTVASGVECAAAVYINKCCIIEDISIKGNRDTNPNAGVKSAGTSRCTLNRVAVSGTYYGFDLQLYLSNITQCTASYNEIGFYFHGNIVNDALSVSYTSLNINTCYAVDSRQYGYYLFGIIYSTLTSCAADGCGVPGNGEITSSTFIGCAYFIYQCKGIVFNSCGLENGLKGVYSRASLDIIFLALNFYFAIRNGLSVDATFEYKNIFNFEYTLANKIISPTITYSPYIRNNLLTDNSKLIRIYGSNPINNIFVEFEDGFSEPEIKYTNFYLEGTVDSNAFKYIRSHFPNDVINVTSLRQIYENIQENLNTRFLSFAITSSNYDGNYIEYRYDGKIVIDGQGYIRDLISTISFKKGTYYIKNLTIRSHSTVTSIGSFIKVEKGANVYFDNCTFITTVEPTDYFVNLVDGKLEFKDCKIYWGVGNYDNVWKFCKPTIFKANISTIESISTTTKVTLPFGEYYDGTDKILAIGSPDYKHLNNLTKVVHSSVLDILYEPQGIWEGCEFYDVDNNVRYQGLGDVIVRKSGPTEQRPTSALTPLSSDKTIGFEYFDKTLSKPIYWNGTAWVDATGTTV